jgi:Ferritin-like
MNNDGKIFPRNLTAKADYVVRGNPTNTRLESGVDNCYPGLEFDQRNLDKAFFPGLIFEFHRNDGAIVREVATDGIPAQAGLTPNDSQKLLYLTALIGKTIATQTKAPVFQFNKLTGLKIWRRVHDLLPGQITIVLASSLAINNRLLRQLLQEEFKIKDGDLSKLPNCGKSAIKRQDNEIVAVLVGERARYLDDNGLIDVDVYQPGDLTRSLCAPWQYDFRDCGCFYWASNKPDIVTSADGTQPYLNFQRRDRSSSQPLDVPPSEGDWYQVRRKQELDYAELIEGAWNQLPVVLNDRESETFIPRPAPPDSSLMTRKEVIEELHYLATVEHALCIEYLYAHYSVNVPPRLPETGADERTKSIFAAANEVFTIAIDEMRHLRWVNEALNLLKQPPSLGRAEIIGRMLRKPFQLEPLTPEQLDWFIEVEEPSQAVGEGIDGMYVRLLTSIDKQPELFPERNRLMHLIKLIIDEGNDHWQRFLAVKKHLAGIEPNSYLRPLQDPQPKSKFVSLQRLSNENYNVLLGALQVSFSLGDKAGGIVLEQSRRAMFNMHETNHYLASFGVRPKFKLPHLPALPMNLTSAHAHVDTLTSNMHEALASVRETGNEAEQALATRQLIVHEQLFQQMHQLINEDLIQ